VFTTLEHAAGADHVAALRPRLPAVEKAAAVLRAFGYAGRPYDFDFDFRTDAALATAAGPARLSSSPVLGRRGAGRAPPSAGAAGDRFPGPAPAELPFRTRRTVPAAGRPGRLRGGGPGGAGAPRDSWPSSAGCGSRCRQVRCCTSTSGRGPRNVPRNAYVLERPDVPDSEAWHRARESSPWSRRIRPQMRLDPGSPAVFRRLRPDPVP
jgi:hypothetical protein